MAINPVHNPKKLVKEVFCFWVENIKGWHEPYLFLIFYDTIVITKGKGGC